jgi:hypothetical protein
MPGEVFDVLRRLWIGREEQDEYFYSLVNACLAAGGDVVGVRSGHAHVDVGTFKGIAHAVPRELAGRSVLDIGCNAGFYSPEMKEFAEFCADMIRRYAAPPQRLARPHLALGA